MQEFSVEDFKK